MAYSAQTTNYGLPLPNGTDKSTWLDTNEGFQAVDTALAGAVAKGSTNEAAIGTLAQRVTAAEANIATDGADIDALETRMTANEQVASNALTGVAQLSEKVYEYTETTFTTAANAFAAISALNDMEKSLVRVKQITTNTNAPGRRTEVYKNANVDITDITDNTAPTFNVFAPLSTVNDTRINAIFGGTDDSYSWTIQTLVLSSQTAIVVSQYEAVHETYTGNFIYHYPVKTITLLMPTAVADD